MKVALIILVALGESVVFGRTISHYEPSQLVEYKHVIPTTPVPILKQDSETKKNGYSYSYEAGNGIYMQESGHLKQVSEKEHAIVAHGSVSYIDPHGKPISLTYIADENGFQPKGDHLPTPPPIPPEILKALSLHASYGHHEEAVAYKGDQRDQAEYDFY